MDKIIILTAFSFIAAALWWQEGADQEISIRSLESFTREGGPVYNKIRWIRDGGRDIWMMNQSHHGVESERYERLAIIVEKHQGRRTARFLQLEPGPLEWSEDLLQKRTAYRVSCFMCHNNGPRAVRPHSEGTSLTVSEQARIFFWNLRIKTYGRVVEHPEHRKEDANLPMPFRHRTDFDNESLKVATCMKCHHEGGGLARGELVRQQALAIGFLVENNLMPPPGFELPQSERQQIKDFVNGF